MTLAEKLRWDGNGDGGRDHVVRLRTPEPTHSIIHALF